MAPYWAAERWIDGLSKGGGQKKRFQFCLKPNCLEKLLYFRAIQGHSGKPYSGNARVNPGGFSTKTGRYAVFFTVVNLMDDEKGLREIFCDLSKQESRLTRFLGNHFKSRFFGAIYCSRKKEDCNFTDKVQCGHPLWHTACRVHWESDMHEN